MAYSNRTCVECGYKSIQPNMKQVEIEYESGSSSAGLSGRAIGFALLGEKKSNNQVGNWMTGNSKRKYMRKRKVWVCNTVGCGSNAQHNKQGFGKSLLKFVTQSLLLVVLFIGAVLIFA